MYANESITLYEHIYSMEANCSQLFFPKQYLLTLIMQVTPPGRLVICTDTSLNLKSYV